MVEVRTMRLGRKERAARAELDRLDAERRKRAKAAKPVPGKYVTNWLVMRPHGQKRHSPSERFNGMNTKLPPSQGRYIPV